MEREEDEANSKFLDPKNSKLYDQFKTVYAEILYRWQLFNQRAEVLKFVSTVPEKHQGIEFVNECKKCMIEVRGPQCGSCKRYTLHCAICNISVKGASNFCLACGHGGHTMHMLEWFEKMDSCPTGCGCNCLEASNSIFGP